MARVVQHPPFKKILSRNLPNGLHMPQDAKQANNHTIAHNRKERQEVSAKPRIVVPYKEEFGKALSHLVLTL